MWRAHAPSQDRTAGAAQSPSDDVRLSMRFRVPHVGTRAVARRNGARLNLDGERIRALAAARVLPVLTHPSRPAALSGGHRWRVFAILTGRCASRSHGQFAGRTQTSLHHEPYFGHLTGPADAWVNGRCDGTYQSEFPPCISASWVRSPYYRGGWNAGRTFNDE